MALSLSEKTVEKFAKNLRTALSKIGRLLTPHARQVLRFLGLPYCYFFLVNWKKCPVSRVQVAWDFLYIFFILRYFPDNYSSCQLFNRPRAEWGQFYGSSYHPFQRAKLHVEVQPHEYQVLFEDKEVCNVLCYGSKIPVPLLVGVLTPGRPFFDQIQEMTAPFDQIKLIAKPVSGSSGSGIFVVEKQDREITFEKLGKKISALDITIKERTLVQKFISQHTDLNTIFSGSLNTLRVLTLLDKNFQPHILSALLRCGVGKASIDNWSAGGLAIGVNLNTGKLKQKAFNKNGDWWEKHPDTNVIFHDFQLPNWPNLLEFSAKVQTSFPFHPMLGLDIAITDKEFLIVEINAFPDLIMQEQASGPLFESYENWRLFRDYDLFVNKHQRALY